MDRGSIFTWMPEKAFGFMKIRGVDAFVHFSAIKGDITNLIGKMVVAQIVADPSRGPGKYKAVAVRRELDHIEEVAAQRAVEAAAAAVRATEEAHRQAMRSRQAVEAAETAKTVARVGGAPPGFEGQIVSGQELGSKPSGSSFGPDSSLSDALSNKSAV